MLNKHDEMLTEELNKGITKIDSELEDFKSATKQIERDEEECLGRLWHDERKQIESNVYECWNGPQARRYVGQYIDDCDSAAKKVRYKADETRDWFRAEMNRLSRRREDKEMEISFIKRMAGARNGR